MPEPQEALLTQREPGLGWEPGLGIPPPIHGLIEHSELLTLPPLPASALL